jgi:hypothetical protein
MLVKLLLFKKLNIFIQKIWEEHFITLKPFQLQSEPTEKKFFLKFNNSTIKLNNDCMIVTMGRIILLKKNKINFKHF